MKNPNLTRALYYRLRRSYRVRLGSDRRWQPRLHTARNFVEERPDAAGEFLKLLGPAAAAVIASSCLPAKAMGRLPCGPKARHYINHFERSGEYAGLNLYKRVALRRGKEQMLLTATVIQFGDVWGPRLHAVNASMRRLANRLEAQVLSLRSQNSRHPGA